MTVGRMLSVCCYVIESEDPIQSFWRLTSQQMYRLMDESPAEKALCRKGVGKPSKCPSGYPLRACRY